jgi:uncharacterized oxidoreductase
MRKIRSDPLQRLSTAIFEAAGTPSDIASTVSKMLVQASLCGVDSHGVIRIPEYIGEIDAGRYKPKERPRIRRQKDGTGIIDGRWGFGQPAGIMAMELAISKAKIHGVGTVLAIRTNHIGRVADYTELAAKNGMIGFGLTNGGPGVAPWQGRDKLLGTNPISFAIPSGDEGPVVMDYATSVSSAGKLEVFKTKGRKVPLGWVQDSTGGPSRDPDILAKGGALRTFGGYKGYGLNLVVEALGGALTGEGVADEFKGANGTFMQAIDIKHFIPLGDFTRDIEKLVSKMHKSKPAKGYDEVLVPGDPERRTMLERSKKGIELNDVVWGSIMTVAKRFGIKEPATI